MSKTTTTLPLTPVQRLIVHEIYKAILKLGGGLELLGAIGSWGDTLEESEVLDLLRHWNNHNI